MNLYKHVSDAINNKLGFTANLEIPKNRDFGDFSSNVAMVMAKSAGKNPRDLATVILSQIKELDFVEDTSVAGPGFINIKLKDKFIWDASVTPDLETNEKKLIIDLDYGSYNVAKSLHIGHMRTSIVGDSFNRVAKFLGHTTFSWNHIGDWGKPMALVIGWIEKLHPELPYFQDNFDINTAVDYEIDQNELNEYYPKSSALDKEDKQFQAHIQDIKVKFQNGHPGYFALFEKFLDISMDMMNNTVEKLNILPFDYNHGERNAAKYLVDVEKILRAKNLIVKSEGAEVIFLKNESDNAPMPPYMWADSRGASTYDSTDLAAVYCRKITDNPDKIIYFTDMRQNLHFQQLFRATELSGIFKAQNMEHIGYGTINGTDGKAFKTRDGNAAGLLDIIEMVTDAVKARVQESGKELDKETINTIALAALKFNDLIHDLRSDYIFDPASVTSFEGRTGPYILYTAVRINNVLSKAGDQVNINAPMINLSPDERNLLIEVLNFERTIQGTFDNRATDILASYTYDLAQSINTFYHNCPILRDDIDAETRAMRLRIAKIASNTLVNAINMMGIKIPPKM